ncbi:hypothetical protein [Ochrobactrum sp. EDr1-4]|uniref:hypothetical protein n=1 Tax=Ochrobactrum sp. EDr1-4 TaxID=3368622 RepID=UPI003BA03878
MKLIDVFTPNDIPSYTYVGREDLKLEEHLRNNMEMPKTIVSISGPSKTGKTVLIKKIIDYDYVIYVHGAAINAASNLWEQVLQWMGTPLSETKSLADNNSIGMSARGEGGVSAVVVKGSFSGGVDYRQGQANTVSSTTTINPLTQVIKEVANSDFVIFIDDFHYIKPEIRTEIGRQVKAAADNGVKILTASVPHRSDDVVRSNEELRGRVAGVDIERWNSDHLVQIADKGFEALGIVVSEEIKRRLADEAMGSPQLMQTICLNLCQVLGVVGPTKDLVHYEVTEGQIEDGLRRTSVVTDYTKLLSSLHAGPRVRGTERKTHALVDGTNGDVYRTVLLAVKQSPVALSFTYDDIQSRIKNVCTGETPSGSSVTSCLEQMQTICTEVQSSSEVLAWDGDTLDIVDPYFAFYLRCSNKLSTLGSVF